MMKNIFRLQRMIRGKDIMTFETRGYSKLRLGNKGACWTICPDILSAKPIGYSFGIGTDISWDIALIENFNCQVFAFDPSPKSLGWVSQQNIPNQFIVHEYGIDNHEGETTFYIPSDENYVSGSILFEEKRLKFETKVKVKPFSKIVNELNHGTIDILKMDIEGAEYKVLDDILNTPVTINQLLIEFHHRMFSFGLDDTKKAVDKIRKAGYKILDISLLGEEYAFIKTNV